MWKGAGLAFGFGVWLELGGFDMLVAVVGGVVDNKSAFARGGCGTQVVLWLGCGREKERLGELREYLVRGDVSVNSVVPRPR